MFGEEPVVQFFVSGITATIIMQTNINLTVSKFTPSLTFTFMGIFFIKLPPGVGNINADKTIAVLIIAGHAVLSAFLYWRKPILLKSVKNNDF